jgi:outer membrane protein assembly factor BamB
MNTAVATSRPDCRIRFGNSGWLAVALAVTVALGFSAIGSDWPQFRGSMGASVGTGEPPVTFGPTTNILWQVPVASGDSSPIIWGERLFLTALNGDKLETDCYDRSKGTLLWRKPAPATRLEPAHRLSSPATPTPATDGERLYVYFGSYGVLAYDFAGNEIWRRELPAPVVEFGTSASPILAGELLILARDQDTDSHLLALDRKTGKTVWRVERPEFRRSFATPFLWRHDGVEELIVPGSIWLKSYNPATGTENWTVSGTSRVATSSPTAGDGLLFSASWNVGGDADDRVSMEPFPDAAGKYDANHDGKLTPQELPDGPVKQRFTQMDLDKDGIVTSDEWEAMRQMFARAGNAVLAIRPGGHGDITKSHVAWRVTRSLPYVSSPLYYQARVFTMKNGGLASCYEATTGKPFYQDQRVGVPGDYYASAVGAGGRIYLASQSGTILVLRSGESLEVLAKNSLGEEIFATPAIVDGTVFVRSATKLTAFRQSDLR